MEERATAAAPVDCFTNKQKWQLKSKQEKASFYGVCAYETTG